VLVWLAWLLVLGGGFVGALANWPILRASVLGVPFSLVSIVLLVPQYFLATSAPPTFTRREALQGFLAASALVSLSSMVVALIGAVVGHTYARHLRPQPDA
jgi:uncharacterized membrane protein